MTSIKISIITVCKNADKYIEKSIKSVACQTYKDIEYIIIDGDSQDRTKEIVLQNSDCISKFVSEPDSGIYAAMNKGIKLASGDFIYFLGADDYLIDENVISDVAEAIKNHPHCEFIYGNIQVRTEVNNSIQVHKPPHPEYILEELICGCLPHQASFTKSHLFHQVGLFNESYKSASDYEWFLRLAQQEDINKVYYDRIIASYYSGGQSSQLEIALQEMFTIQDKAPIYQTEYWLKARIAKYQNIILNPQGYWGLFRIEEKAQVSEHQDNLFPNQLQTALAEIEAMKTSKFWKLRSAWFKVKEIINLK
ncbi:glycosyltransferase [Nostoc spongiaeforme FACHB-130]|uniref:Glycosyltransferase n=1 Tax=Nostoc spongiaeforme FACHB-130 TaxID=1357510 RepID=A0ABR8G522_9NOSO|nr:glycosyltransferase family 2 protein [Nostoc spongiaeforme]MBD2598340.1 glycosyltransferase [Nostoc spongiaeforme FACHB-130]